jgi:predicted DCC family thiol-disulfide oxidoreductase YuxK
MLTAYYDSDCALCGRSMLWVRSWWRKGGLTWRPYAEARHAAPRWDPDQMLVHERLDHGDRWYLGADAVIRLMRDGPWHFAAAAAFGGLPFLRHLVRAVYSRVARARRSFD